MFPSGCFLVGSVGCVMQVTSVAPVFHPSERDDVVDVWSPAAAQMVGLGTGRMSVMGMDVSRYWYTIQLLRIG